MSLLIMILILSSQSLGISFKLNYFFTLNIATLIVRISIYEFGENTFGVSRLLSSDCFSGLEWSPPAHTYVDEYLDKDSRVSLYIPPVSFFLCISLLSSILLWKF